MCTAPLPSGERDTPSPNPSPSAPRPRAFGTQPRHLRRLIPLFLFLMLAYLLLYLLNLLTCSTCYPSVCLVTHFLGGIFMYNFCIPCIYLFLSSLFTSYVWSLLSGDPFVCLSPLPCHQQILSSSLPGFLWCLPALTPHFTSSSTSVTIASSYVLYSEGIENVLASFLYQSYSLFRHTTYCQEFVFSVELN